MQSAELRQVRQLQQQLEKDGLTLAVYDLDGKEVDVDDAIASLTEAEKLAERLGLDMVLRNPSTGRGQRKAPVKATARKSMPLKKPTPRKVDGRTSYGNALKRIMKEKGCTRKEAQEIFRQNQSTAQGKKAAKKTSKKSPAKKKASGNQRKRYVAQVRKTMKENDCSYREAQEILKKAA